MKQINIIILILSFFAISCNIKGSEKNLRTPNLQNEIDEKCNFHAQNSYNKIAKFYGTNILNPLTWYYKVKEAAASLELRVYGEEGPIFNSLKGTIESYTEDEVKKVKEAENNLVGNTILGLMSNFMLSSFACFLPSFLPSCLNSTTFMTPTDSDLFIYNTNTFLALNLLFYAKNCYSLFKNHKVSKSYLTKNFESHNYKN